MNEQHTYTVTNNLLEASEAAGLELARLRYCFQKCFYVDDVTATWVTALLISKIISVTNNDEEYRKVLSEIVTKVSSCLTNEPPINT